jgi:hypothetical protein
VLERLPGADFGDVIPHLVNKQLDYIAAKVAHAQSLVGETISKGRYAPIRTTTGASLEK